nr:uncharacterized protein LOC123290052 isoform X1 [Equus asinus]
MTSRGVMQVTRRARASSKMRKQHTQGRAQMGKLLQTNHTPPQGCWPAGTREATEADLHLTSTFQMLCCELPDGDGPTWQGTDVSGSQAGRTRGCQQSLETADILYVYNGYLIRVFNRKEMNQLQKNHLSYLKVFIKVPHTAICRSTEDAKKKALSFAFKGFPVSTCGIKMLPFHCPYTVAFKITKRSGMRNTNFAFGPGRTNDDGHTPV